VTGRIINEGRRRFFLRVIKQDVVEPAVRIEREIQNAKRRRDWERAYESDLLAFGPDVLADAARRSGVAQEGADYADVAKALARGMKESGDER